MERPKPPKYLKTLVKLKREFYVFFSFFYNYNLYIYIYSNKLYVNTYIYYNINYLGQIKIDINYFYSENKYIKYYNKSRYIYIQKKPKTLSAKNTMTYFIKIKKS